MTHARAFVPVPRARLGAAGRHIAACLAAVLALVGLGPIARAGVTNPDISVIGQPFARLSTDPGDPNHDRLALDPGEAEVMADAYLNPYARGTFVFSFGEGGVEVEEGYFTLERGLPAALALKAGQYRCGFGKLNPAHPHAVPFADRFDMLASYLPGEESLNETGVSLSRRFPIVGDFSVNASLDWLQGNTFRLERESSGDPGDPLEAGGDDDAGQTRAAWLGRLSGSTLVGDQSAVEFGLSATGGTNNVAARARTRVMGADVKAKLWNSPSSYLVLQGEFMALHRDEAAWSAADGYTKSAVSPVGGYLFADYNFKLRYNVGASYERYQQPTEDKPWNQSIGAFVGYSLMEETTAFRADWRHTMPDGGDSFDTFTLRAIFSMGPHKAHQF